MNHPDPVDPSSSNPSPEPSSSGGSSAIPPSPPGSEMASTVSSAATPSTNDRDFQLQLYSRLWENVNAKESRVWTFLSIYGAAVGLALTSNAVERIGPLLASVVLLLTGWAIHLVINADWWSHRNRLMIGGVEETFPSACIGIIPSFYSREEPWFRIDRLHQVSILLMVVLATLVYGRVTLDLSKVTGIQSGIVAIQLIAMNLIYLAIAAMALARLEANLGEYYATWRDLTGRERADEWSRERQNRWQNRWRIWAAVLVVAACLLFDLCFLCNTSGQAVCFVVIAAVAQCISFALYVHLSSKYYSKSLPFAERRDHDVPAWDWVRQDDGSYHLRKRRLQFWAFGLLVIASVVAAIPVFANQNLQAPSTTAADLLDEIKSVDARLKEIRATANAQQRREFENLLQEYLKSSTADQTYINKQNAEEYATKVELQQRITAADARRQIDQVAQTLDRRLKRLEEQAAERSTNAR